MGTLPQKSELGTLLDTLLAATILAIIAVTMSILLHWPR